MTLPCKNVTANFEQKAHLKPRYFLRIYAGVCLVDRLLEGSQRGASAQLRFDTLEPLGAIL
jgi:hypothetical protein